ncbi:isoamylase 2, chloroplastic [Castanea sativa]|uniref:isoamylase 2, chloroplastic n=1 Tax=Castanea sativa TaxID=21020 RepID=UPI003F64E2B6
MATLPPSLAIQSCYLKCGISDVSKSSPACHYMYRNSIRYGFEKMDLERRLICDEVSQNVVKSSCRHLNSRVFATSRALVEEIEQKVSTITEADNREKALTYLFWTEVGGQVKVFVRKTSVKYAVNIEVSSLQLQSSNDRLTSSWGRYRADSSSFIPLDVQSSVPDSRTSTSETPFIQTSAGRFALELEFEAKQIPFYLSFILKLPSDSSSGGSEIRSHRKTNFCVPVGFRTGYPAPLGLSFSPDGSMNFAIFSRNVEGVILCFYDDAKANEPALELDLDPYINRSGDIWHASLESSRTFVSYGYRCKGSLLQRNNNKFDAGKIILDPYAKIIVNSIPSSDGSLKYLGRPCKEPGFDWGDDTHPYLPMEKLVVYRLNVRHFTEHKSSQLATDVAGTFIGLTEKLQHFKDLGMNAVLLEPIFSFDEKNGPYFPCHFFSPMNLYGPSGDSVSAINSMKEMVKKLHANGIEVLLEVVFTHTAMAGSLQGIDDLSYYHVNEGEDLEATNDLNCNYPIVSQLILDSLQHWVTEFHIDGFCFVNASSLLRGFHGEYLSRPPLVEAIAFDPLLSKTKIIADCWDPHDMLPKETRFPHWKRWAEIDTKFCNDVRNFWRGEGLLSDLATRLCGSGDIFSDGRGPAFSFNFIARNFGLTLVDLVSFSNDALASQLSWNCGEEGPTDSTTVLERRLKQIRNFLFVLYVSLGVPILNMGDECGQSCGGSPAYSDRKPLDWNTLKTGFSIQTSQFISFLSSLRMRRSDLLQKRNFLKEENIEWHGSDQSPPKWEDPSCRFLAMTLRADEVESPLNSESSSHVRRGDLFIAFNAADHSESVILPQPPEGMSWCCLVDTALPFPGFFSTSGEPLPEQMAESVAYEMKSHSCALFEASSSLKSN